MGGAPETVLECGASADTGSAPMPPRAWFYGLAMSGALWMLMGAVVWIADRVL